MYRRERKKGTGSTSSGAGGGSGGGGGSAIIGTAKRPRLGFSDDGSSSSTQPEGEGNVHTSNIILKYANLRRRIRNLKDYCFCCGQRARQLIPTHPEMVPAHNRQLLRRLMLAVLILRFRRHFGKF